MRRALRTFCLTSLLLITSFLGPVRSSPETAPTVAPRPAPQPIQQAKAVSRTLPRAAIIDDHHPKHIVKVWLTTYRNRTFRVIQLPRCQHIEAVISYEPRGETKEQAKDRLDGIAVCSGAFHNSRSMALADFYQLDGSILSGARTGRWFLAIDQEGQMGLSGDYALMKGTPGITALALGQRLAPDLHRDGFTTAFMNRKTDRMALGMNSDYIFIVQGKTDIWRLAEFMQDQLPCDVAVNCDGGHVVRGRAPVHIVFRWREEPADDTPIPDIQNLRISEAPTKAES